mgnify:CR=1 FL=1
MKRCPLMAAVCLLVALATVRAGDDATGCKPPACGAMECVLTCRPVVKKVPIEKERFNVECEFICVPPVQLPRFCRLLGGGCDHDVCETACTNDCRARSAAATRFPWQAGGKCTKCDRIRKVHRLSREEYECGEKCVVEWKLECVCRPIQCKPAGACGSGDHPGSCAPTGW